MNQIEIIHNLPNDEYHSRPEIGSSDLRNFRVSAANYRYKKDHPPEPTPAMKLGSQFDHLFFYGKLDPGLKISAKDEQTVKEMVESLRSNRTAMGLFSNGEEQLSYFWTDRQTGLGCKSRPDWVNHKHRIIVDLKSAVDASEDGFNKAIANFRYHWQAYWYDIPLQYDRFMFVAVEKKPPYHIGIYEADEEMLYLAEQEIKWILPEIMECQASGVWPKPKEEIKTAKLPRWYLAKAII